MSDDMEITVQVIRDRTCTGAEVVIVVTGLTTLVTDSVVYGLGRKRGGGWEYLGPNGVWQSEPGRLSPRRVVFCGNSPCLVVDGAEIDAQRYRLILWFGDQSVEADFYWPEKPPYQEVKYKEKISSFLGHGMVNVGVVRKSIRALIAFLFFLVFVSLSLSVFDGLTGPQSSSQGGHDSASKVGAGGSGAADAGGRASGGSGAVDAGGRASGGSGAVDAGGRASSGSGAVDAGGRASSGSGAADAGGAVSVVPVPSKPGGTLPAGARCVGPVSGASADQLYKTGLRCWNERLHDLARLNLEAAVKLGHPKAEGELSKLKSDIEQNR